MYREINVGLSPKYASDIENIKNHVKDILHVSRDRIKHVDILRRSIDARKRDVMVNMLLAVHIDEIHEIEKCFKPEYRDVSGAKSVIVVGAGPAGIFAALRLIERGYKPIVVERGKAVEDRKADLAKLYKTGIPDDDSNFGFGEGGAGTFSDGKLFTRSKKRGDVRRVMEILVYHGAAPEILVDSHPHIGTDKLPKVIVNIRKTIEKYGGVFMFSTKFTDVLIENNRVRGIVAGDKEILADNVIVATGHSARDVYKILHKRNVMLEAKDFAVGLRVEHSQYDIDCMQYHTKNGRGEYLPAAEYNFVTNINDRGVYSFCMCPGGVIVPAATGKYQQVVNGMSASGRNTPWANSAIVTQVGVQELSAMNFTGLFAGIEFQEYIEKSAWEHGGCNLYAPAQLLKDFLRNRESSELPRSSYKPGVKSSMISSWFPDILRERLQKGFKEFGRKAPAFLSDTALLLGVETRTSSPLRIPRDRNLFRHIEIEGLYPCGEGAGFAGGIISAAVDGENCANAIF